MLYTAQIGSHLAVSGSRALFVTHDGAGHMCNEMRSYTFGCLFSSGTSVY